MMLTCSESSLPPPQAELMVRVALHGFCRLKSGSDLVALGVELGYLFDFVLVS